MLELNRIKVGWNLCVVKDIFLVTRCFKCQEYGHIAKNCKNKLTCGKCTGSHEFKTCQSTSYKCVNCVKSNQIRNTKYATDHLPGSNVCSLHQMKVEQLKEQIDGF